MSDIESGVQQARRIITNAYGYYFGGDLIPFDEHLRALALEALSRLSQSTPPNGSLVLTGQGEEDAETSEFHRALSAAIRDINRRGETNLAADLHHETMKLLRSYRAFRSLLKQAADYWQPLLVQVTAERDEFERMLASANEAGQAALNQKHLADANRDAALLELAAAREELSTAKSVINEIIDIAHRHGWNGVENSKVLTHFLDHALPTTKELRRCKADRPIKQWFPDMPLKNLHDDDGSVCTHGLRDGLWDDYTEKQNAE